MKKKFNPNTAFALTAVGIDRVRHGKYAFGGESRNLFELVSETFASNEICDLMEMEFRRPSHLGFSVSPQSPYRETAKIM